MPEEKHEWTGKLPGIVGGTVLLLLGALTIHHTKYVAVGIILIAAGIAFLAYGTSVPAWCVPETSQFTAKMTWGSHVFKAPSLWECLSLTR